MRLHEFTDARQLYAVPTGMAAIIEEVKQVWRGHGIDANAPLFSQIIDEPAVEKSELIHTSANKFGRLATSGSGD